MTTCKQQSPNVLKGRSRKRYGQMLRPLRDVYPQYTWVTTPSFHFSPLLLPKKNKTKKGYKVLRIPFLALVNHSLGDVKTYCPE